MSRLVAPLAEWLGAWFGSRDASPVNAQAPCVRGVDVSGWQDPINWRAAYTSGVRFNFVKASEGLGHVSPGWKRHARPSADAGMRLGAYHFARLAKWRTEADARSAGIAQASACLEVCAAPGQPSLLTAPVLDLEWECEKAGNRPSPTLLACFVDAWRAEVEVATGLAAPLYLAPSYYRWRWEKSGLGANLLQRMPLWIPKYQAKPWPDPAKAPALGDVKATLWQTTGKGSLPGANGNPVRVDCNLFLGTDAELAALGRAA